MSTIMDLMKRVMVGRPFRTDRLQHVLLPKRLALPIFSSDALSSVAYAPNEIFLTLAVAGVSAYTFSWQIGLVVALVLTVVVLSYRQNVHAYPSGGGDYEVSTVNLGPNAGLTVASALLVDYVLTVAVSIASAVHYVSGTVSAVRGYEVYLAVALITVLAVVNLRGLKESGRAFAIPTYFFMAVILGTAGFGFVKMAMGNLPFAESAAYGTYVQPEFADDSSLFSVVGVFLLMRAFSSGCAALTGVEAISNGVPAFTQPRSKNAASTLAMLGVLAVTMLMSVIVLARAMKVTYVDEKKPWDELTLNNQLGEAMKDGGVRFADGTEYHQLPIISQISKALYADMPVLFVLVTIATGLILILAANTAFNGFPILGSILAQDKYLPQQLRTRGDRLTYSNGILMLAGAASVLVIVYRAEVTSLIQLYIVGVFISFTLSQLGMTKHWAREIRREPNAGTIAKMRRSQIINYVGFVMTGSVLVIVVVTKFMHGAWLALVAMGALFVMMKLIKRHYEHVARELELPQEMLPTQLPSRVHAIVLVSDIHLATLRALAYARSSRPSTLEAVVIGIDDDTTRALITKWSDLDLPASIKVIESPYREFVRPLVEYIKQLRRASPRDLVVIYVPEYVVGRWFETLLHNQNAARLKVALRYVPGVVVTSVPWQLSSSKGVEQRLGGSGTEGISELGGARPDGQET